MEKGIEYLRRKLNKKRWRVNVRYKYYEMKNVTRDLGISTPPGLRNWYSVLGWNAKAVDALAAAKNVASGTHTEITSITLPAGSWLVYCGVRFPSNANGRRQANLSATSGSNSMDWGCPPVNGSTTQFTFTKGIVNSSTATYHLNVYQNSGSTLSMPAGSATNYNCIYAVRIA